MISAVLSMLKVITIIGKFLFSLRIKLTSNYECALWIVSGSMKGAFDYNVREKLIRVKNRKQRYADIVIIIKYTCDRLIIIYYPLMINFMIIDENIKFINLNKWRKQIIQSIFID